MPPPDEPDDATFQNPETAIGWVPPAPGGAAAAPPPAAPRPAPAPPIEPGTRLGDRYAIRALLGRGGMGAVYRALDEKLGEEVALKAVGGASDRALRDEVRLAQKVAHPNVCRTYDLEEVGGQLFVKMEFVEGETLATRLKRERKLPIDEAVRIARTVAAGLAAAHAQGIVHRDLKPSNVMLSGPRVVLMDFGIARLVTSSMNTLAGTFGYMAPEQFANTRVDRRADLYGLGCLLYEMLAGELVFGAANPVELAARHVMVEAPDVRGKRPDTPRWLARAIAALLAKDPAGREPGLARLMAGPRRWRRVVVPAAALAAAAAAAIVLWPRARAADPGPPPCGPEHRLDGVWDDAVKQQVQRAFTAAAKPFAAHAFATAEHGLDHYAQAWSAAVTDACAATRVRHEQTEEVLGLRQACLDRRLDELRALVGVLVAGDAAVIAKAAVLADQLDPISDCANITALLAPDRPPTEPAAKVAEVGKQLAEGKVEAFAGHQLAALDAAKRAEHLADDLHYAPYKAEALETQGIALGLSGNVEDGAADCAAATWQALTGRRDDLAADSATCAAGITAQRNVGEARVWLGLARTLAPRSGDDPMRETRLLEAEHLIAAASGDRAAAVAAQERELVVAERVLGKDDPALWIQEEAIGEALATGGAYAKATPHFERALALHQQAVGADHPDITNILTNLGACYAHTGEAAKAKAAYDRALATIERVEGDGVDLARTLNNMADAATKAGDAAGALVYLDRAQKIAEAKLGDAHPLTHAVLVTRAEALAAAGRRPEARAQYDQALALETRYGSPYVAATLSSRAAMELADRKWSDAASFARRAVAAAEASGGKDSPDLWQPLAVLGRADVELGRPDDARPVLERAIAIAEKAQATPADLAPARDALAKLTK